MMGCCGDKTREVLNMTKHIAQGWYNLVLHKSHENTKTFRNVCRNCEHNRFLGIRGICGICKCFLPAKTRVPLKSREINGVIVKEMVVDCPKGFWPHPSTTPAKGDH